MTIQCVAKGDYNLKTELIMKKTGLIIMVFIWVLALIILIISLTDLYPNTVFQENRSIVGIVFIIITGFLRLMYKSVKKVS